MSTWRFSTTAAVGSLSLDVEFEGGDAPVVLIGPNGSGKTTILRIVAGLLRPTQAELVVKGRVLHRTAKGIDTPPEARRVGYVPQGHGLFPTLDVLDNVAFGLSIRTRRTPRAERRQRATEVLERLGCAHLSTRFPLGLSGGERQRVAMARALLLEPDLLLLDEPLAALDATARRDVRRFLVRHLRSAGCPALIVSHEPRDALALGAHVVALEAGRVAQRGSIEELRAAPATAFVSAFVETLESDAA